NGVAGIDVVAARPRRAWALRRALVPRDALDEGVLLVGVRLPQEAAHLVVADADALEQVLDPGGRVADGEGGFDPVADLVGVAEAAGAELGLELLDLLRGKFARVALVVDLAEGVEPFVAKAAEPFAQLAEADPQQLSDFFSRLAGCDRQHSSQALVNSPVKGILAAAFDFPALLSSQHNRLHGQVLTLLDVSACRILHTTVLYSPILLRRRYINLNPKIGCMWMRKGQQAEVMTPGDNAKRHLAGSLHWRTGALITTEGPKRDGKLFVAHLHE